MQNFFKKIGVIAALYLIFMFSGCGGYPNYRPGFQNGYLLSGDPIADAVAISYAYQNTPVKVASYNQPYYYDKPYYYNGGRYYYGGHYRNGNYYFRGRRLHGGHYYNRGVRHTGGRQYTARNGVHGYYDNKRSYLNRNSKYGRPLEFSRQNAANYGRNKSERRIRYE